MRKRQSQTSTENPEFSPTGHLSIKAKMKTLTLLPGHFSGTI